MIRFIRLGPALGAVVAACLLWGCTPPDTQKTACPYTPYAPVPNAPQVDIPPPKPGETVEDVLIPGGKLVGCLNPRYRLVRGTGQDAKDLFDRLTKDADQGDVYGYRYGGKNFLTGIRIRKSDHVAVGWRTAVACRRPLVWIFQWPDETGNPHFKPVLLEFSDDLPPCKPGDKDADGGGP